MRKIIYLLAFSALLLSCKTKLIVHDFKAINIPNFENISTIDSSLINFITPYTDEVMQEMQEVIAFSEKELIRKKPESLLTNYLTDMLLYEGRMYASKLQSHPVPDAAYLNYGGIRTDLPRGPITIGKIFELMPFENELAIIRLKGKDMQEMAKVIAAKGGDCIAGMKITINADQSVRLEINERLVDPQMEYWIVTNDYVANGGDNMNMLLNRSIYINSGIKLRDCFINHMRNEYLSGKKISPTLDGRICYE